MKKRTIGLVLMGMVMMAPTFAMASGHDDVKIEKRQGTCIEMSDEVRAEYRELKDLYKEGNMTKEEYKEKYKEIFPNGGHLMEKFHKDGKFEGKEHEGKGYDGKEYRKLKASKEWMDGMKSYFDGEIDIDELVELHKTEHVDKDMKRDIDYDKFEERMELKKSLVNGEITDEEYCEALGIDHDRFQEKAKLNKIDK